MLDYLADQHELGMWWETLAWKGLGTKPISGQDGQREGQRARKKREGTMKASR